MKTKTTHNNSYENAPQRPLSRENCYEKTSILEDITHYEKRIKSLMRKRAAVPPDADSTNS